MKTFKGRPLIRNATPPWHLFNKIEIDLITEAVKRSVAMERWGTKPKVPAKELAALKELFNLAAFHAYMHEGIGINGKVRWAVICEPESQKLKEHMVVTTIKRCEECGNKFHAKHYWKFNPKFPGTEIPPDMCNKCEIKAEKKENRSVRQEDIPF